MKDGKIIFYYFREGESIYIYNGKSFKKLFEINLYKEAKKSKKENSDKATEKEKNKKEEEEEEENGYDDKYRYYFLPSEKYKRKNIKNCIKELDNDLILIGHGTHLFEINLKEKSYDSKIVKIFENIILEINELADRRIIIITDKNILFFQKVENEYIIKNEYLIHDNWKIVPLSSKGWFHGDFNQYYYSYVLPNNRLLLNSFSTEKGRYGWCGTHPPDEYSQSKIIFIDMNNFTEIKSTEEYGIDTRCILLANSIIIQAHKNFFIYDINSLEIIKNIKLDKFYGYIYKYDEQNMILLSEDEKKNDLYILKYQNIIINLCLILEIKESLFFVIVKFIF